MVLYAETEIISLIYEGDKNYCRRKAGCAQGNPGSSAGCLRAFPRSTREKAKAGLEFTAAALVRHSWAIVLGWRANRLGLGAR